MKRIGETLQRFKNRLGKAAELESFESFSMLMDANGTLTFTGERRIEAYGDNEIAAVFQPGRICVNGRDLFLFELTERETSICGVIEEIRFERGTEGC